MNVENEINPFVVSTHSFLYFLRRIILLNSTVLHLPLKYFIKELPHYPPLEYTYSQDQLLRKLARLSAAFNSFVNRSNNKY